MQKYLFIAVIIIAAFLKGMVVSAQIQPQTRAVLKNSEGTEFWLCFQKNYRDNSAAKDNSDPLDLELFITGDHDANVSVEIEGIGFKKDFLVRLGTVYNLKIDPRAQVVSQERAERLAVHVTSDAPVSVYGLNHRFQTTDTYMGLPVSVLGTEYRAVSYKKLAGDLLSQLAIIATEDGTEVTITPSSATSGMKPADKPFKVNLRRGDVYQVEARYDPLTLSELTGTLITANKKISVFSGHNCAYVPSRVDACNHLVEQLPPISSWGKHFYVGQFKGRSRYTLRVVASEPKTKVFEDTRLVAILNPGEFYENTNLRTHVQITADNPVLVAQYAQGFRNGDSIGDPMMILISPSQQFVREYRFATPISGQWRHYVNIFVLTDQIDSLSLNGRRVNKSEFSPLGVSRYSLAQIQVPFGTHVMKCPTPFGLYSYGFGYDSAAYDAYGNMGGQSFTELEDVPDRQPPVADGKESSGNFNVIFRDDRVNDRGMYSLEIVAKEGLDAIIPIIEGGVPQVTLPVRPVADAQNGKMVLRATDMAENSSTFTICHSLNPNTGNYAYSIVEGNDTECGAPASWWEAGAYLTGSQIFHSANFSSSGNISIPGTFSDGSGNGGYFGLLFGRRLNKDFGLNARLSFENFAGEISAPDSTARDSVRDPKTDILVPLQYERVLELQNLYVSLSIAGEWNFHRFMYLLAGVKNSFALGDGITLKRRILQPQGFTFENKSPEYTEPENTLTSLNSFGFAGFGGFGVTYPVTNRINIVAEGIYTQYFTHIISDGTWKVKQLSFNLGARYKF
ncbi:MAG: IgGFc-binding protein [Bacteroidota bacterium]